MRLRGRGDDQDYCCVCVGRDKHDDQLRAHPPAERCLSGTCRQKVDRGNDPGSDGQRTAGSQEGRYPQSGSHAGGEPAPGLGELRQAGGDRDCGGGEAAGFDESGCDSWGSVIPRGKPLR
jgi:hypothetical protein